MIVTVTTFLPETTTRATDFRPGRIVRVEVTPVAFHDMPLLNSVGVHEPFALRSVVEVVTASGTYGLGESYGDEPHLHRMEAAAAAIVGLDAHETGQVYAAVVEALRTDDGIGGHGMSGMVTGSATPDRVFSPFEVACLDVQGKLAGVPVSDLLGGRVRDRVAYSAYLFYKWAGHPGEADDEYGEALDPAGLVRQAHKIIDEYGFSSIKLKGGVFPPATEVAAIRALREAFPDLPSAVASGEAFGADVALAEASLGGRTVALRLVAKEDDVAQELIDLSYEDGVTQLVMGLKRRSPVGKLIMGSTTQKVMLDARCPVTAVKPPVTTSQ